MSQKSNDQITTSSDETKTQKSERPQTLGEENSLLQQNFQESSNSSGGLCHLKWATCFESLMQDGDGLRLFRTFLARDDQANLAEFYIACNGYKMAFAKSGPNLAKNFYRKLIKGDQLNLSRPVKKALVKALKTNQIDQFIFDDAQNEVETILRNVYYPQFLKSDIYENYAEAEVECTRQGSQSESPERWKQSAPAATQPENTRSTREVNATVDTDMSLSFSSMSLMSEDKNRSRVDPLGFKNNVKEAKHRQLEASRHRDQSVDATDFEDNVKHVSMVSASLVDSSSRSFTSDPVNTDGMSFTSSSRDERDMGRPKGHWVRHPPSNKGMINTTKDMSFTVAPRQLERRERFNLSEVDPPRFFKEVERKLLDLKGSAEETAARERATRASAPVAGNTSTAHHHHHRSLYQHPNDYDHLRALDESITRIDLGSVRAPKWDAHNVTMPAYPPQDVHKRQDQPQPQYAESSGHFKQPYPPVQWNAPYAPRQFSDQYSYRGGQMQNHPNRSFAQPFNQSFNNSQHVTQAYSYHNQRPLHPSTYNYTSYPVYPPQQYVGPHPPVINPNRGPNSNPQNSILSDLTNEKVKAWMRTTEEYDVGKSKGSGDVSEHSLKKSSHTDRTRKACSSRQSKHSRVSELNASQSTAAQLNQSAQQDQNILPVLNSTSTSNSTTASANTVIAVGQISSETSLSSANNANASATSAPPSSVTVVKYYLDGETIPYLTKIPGRNITLGQFKRFLAKRGKFRYFFKTLCQDFEDGAIQEEVMEDGAVVPLWRGMIECKVNSMPSDDESIS